MYVLINPFKPEFTIVIFIHYIQPRTMLSQFSTLSGLQMKKKIVTIKKSYMNIFLLKPQV